MEAAAELDRETRLDAGGDRKSEEIKVAGRHFETTRADAGTRDGIRRRLERYAGDPAACAEKGTTAQRGSRIIADGRPQLPWACLGGLDKGSNGR